MCLLIAAYSLLRYFIDLDSVFMEYRFLCVQELCYKHSQSNKQQVISPDDLQYMYYLQVFIHVAVCKHLFLNVQLLCLFRAFQYSVLFLTTIVFSVIYFMDFTLHGMGCSDWIFRLSMTSMDNIVNKTWECVSNRLHL